MSRKRQQVPLRTPSFETVPIRELDQANKLVTEYVTYSTEDGQRRIAYKVTGQNIYPLRTIPIKITNDGILGYQECG